MLNSALTTKPIAVLVLGCLPLAVLTVAAFAGIGDLDSKLPSIHEGDLVPASASVSVPSSEDMKGDELLCGAVTEREFLAGESLPERTLDAKPIYCDSLAADWRQWSDATDLVHDILAVEGSLIDAELAKPKSLDAQLAKLESGLNRFEEIREECRRKDPAGSAGLAGVLERRCGELQEDIAHRRRQDRAEKLCARAEGASDAGKYEESITLFSQVLRDYSDVVDSKAVNEQLEVAQFWHGEGDLSLDTPVTAQPSEQRDALVRFLSKHEGIREEAVLRRTQEISRKLELVQVELRRLEMNETALQPISALAKYDDRPFGEGLPAAAQIAEDYPTVWVRSQVQQRVVAWLTRALPVRKLDEAADMEEVETTSGSVLRGFFEPVPDAGGGVIGYKSYPTAAERKSPTRNVGRYPVADLRGVPTRSVPRQCVDAYASARGQLLADAGDLERWRTLRRTCESAESALTDYRRKPGSSRETLTFDGTIQLTKTVLTPSVWSQMQAVWKE